MKSRLEERLAYELDVLVRAGHIPPYVREYRPIPDRRWRVDFAWPDSRLAVEVEGGLWIGGRHGRAVGYAGDCEKYNAMTRAGWRVLRYTSSMLGTAAKEVCDVLSEYGKA